MTELVKLRIKPEDASKLPEIVALFNPNTYSVTKGISWKSATARSNSAGDNAAKTEVKKNAPALEFDGGQGRKLNLELFFDTTEGDGTVDVRLRTNQVAKLTRIVRDLPGGPRPPTCTISWGKAPPDSDFPFTGVIAQLVQRFTLFRPSGIPVRATLTVEFTEYLDPEKDKRQTDPEFTTRLFKRGDSLSAIAAEVYSDPAQWRVVAEANQLDDPRKIPIGLRLNIPKLS